MNVRFENTYSSLPERFYTRLAPEPVAEPRTIRVNEALAEQLGFDSEWLASDEGAQFAVGNRILEGADPVAMVYAGHQFGNWVPRLGDGRAILLGEVIDREGERFDLQLKGSGRTPYSRQGDGRSPLGPVLREYIISEAMAALGIPTTRSLVAASTGERVRRETMLPGGVLVRVASSHVRVGTFEYFAAREDVEALALLVEHVIERHYPELEGASPLGLLEAVGRNQAELVARWQLVGFIHGVMNTDNTLLSGETIDYGPCAFMNAYDPATVFSSIDRGGRYAYGNQPRIAQWNLARLAETMLQLTGVEEGALERAQAVIESFPVMFREAYSRGIARKLGLSEVREEDAPLVEDLLELMRHAKSDYTLTFRHLTELAATEAEPGRQLDPSVSQLMTLSDSFEPWIARWRARFGAEETPASARQSVMQKVNPLVIPRNHLVEKALEEAVDGGDFSRFHELVDVLADPFQWREDVRDFARPPRSDERVVATFCGT